MNRPRLHLVPGAPVPPEEAALDARIAKIGDALKRAQKMGAFGVSRCVQLQEELRLAIASRTPEHIARLERARGLRA